MPQPDSRTPPPAAARAPRRVRPGTTGERARSAVSTLADRWRLSPAVRRELAAYRRGQGLPYWHREQR